MKNRYNMISDKFMCTIEEEGWGWSSDVVYTLPAPLITTCT